MIERDLRIGDAEREQATSRLADHYAAGRLTTDEHAERLDAAWSARTYRDLEPLFADLPDDRPDDRRAGSDRQPRHAGWRWGPPMLLPPLVLLLVLAAVLHAPWLLFALFGFCMFGRGGHPRHGCRAGPGGSRR